MKDELRSSYPRWQTGFTHSSLCILFHNGFFLEAELTRKFQKCPILSRSANALWPFATFQDFGRKSIENPSSSGEIASGRSGRLGLHYILSAGDPDSIDYASVPFFDRFHPTIYSQD